MFGPKIAEWVGKRVALYATNKLMAMNGEDAIRVWGSPDIAADIEVEYSPPRRKSFRMTMKAMKGGVPAAGPKASAEPPGDEYNGRVM